MDKVLVTDLGNYKSEYQVAVPCIGKVKTIWVEVNGKEFELYPDQVEAVKSDGSSI